MIKKLLEELASTKPVDVQEPKVDVPADPMSTIVPASSVLQFVGMVRLESILSMLDSDSDGCSSHGSSDNKPCHHPSVGVYMAGTPAPGATVDAIDRPTPEALERAHQMLQAGMSIVDETLPEDLNAYHFVMKEQVAQLAQE